ncbi:heterokaryon incompatibility protein-domain-containing protein [Lophiotrema nucula]|uniref:Heterokaryon incompatibility protein-domain-containing protein n=1 Tax=Lophiotrema nucula TaxID=690887 RepID=A0A6A5ZDX4_9PLEO|nr:heterokaryon incompatibility protein-domain-containing protein [Lophiotrema nucula]
MRLLHVEGDPWSDDPLSITLCEYYDASQIPPYMILSHRWRDEEVSFTDMTSPDPLKARSRKGYTKLETSCRTALQLNLSYAWVDTCCIDKSSSAELSEAINSMYEWYATSSTCVAFLDDVEIYTRMPAQDHGEAIPADRYVFEDSEWFRRELIAPKEVSGIPREVFMDPDKLKKFCIADRMSWAASRQTTRREDEAYSLLGLFGVNIPPLYGEGRRRAFQRLQIEIMSTTHDHTIFAWESTELTGDMLAPSVQSFQLSDQPGYRKLSYEEYMDAFDMDSAKLDYSMTNTGVHIELPICKVPYHPGLYFAFLACIIRKRRLRTSSTFQMDRPGQTHGAPREDRFYSSTT